MGRHDTVAEVAKAVGFLLYGDSGSITAQDIVADEASCSTSQAGTGSKACRYSSTIEA